MIPGDLKTAEKRILGDKAGFTLVEVLVAMTIAAIVIASTAGAVKIAMNALEKGDFVIETENRKLWFETQVKRQIASISYRRMDGKNKIDFSGLPQGMRFVTTASLSGSSSASVYIANYRIESYGDLPFYRLVVEEANYSDYTLMPINDNGSMAGKVGSKIILDGFKDIHFYYLQPSMAGEAKFQDKWSGSAVPAAVVIEVTTPEDVKERYFFSVRREDYL